MALSFVVHVIDYGEHRNLMLRYRHPVSRKAVAKTSGTRDPKKAAKLAARWEQELNDGAAKVAAPVSWGEFRTRYRREHLAGLARGTEMRNGNVLDIFGRAMNPQLLADVSGEMISTYQAKLRAGEFGNGQHKATARKSPTVALHLRVLRSALSWAVEIGMLDAMPNIRRNPRTKKAGKSKVMKGRPITEAEFAAMLDAIPAVVAPDHAPAWERILRGLWLSGLRLDEAIRLSWDDRRVISVDLSHSRPMFRVIGEGEKGGQDRILPMAPDFAEFLLMTPASDRAGLVFPLPPRRVSSPKAALQSVSKTISAIGKASKIVVDDRTGKHASAHDLRRSFGERWALRVSAQILMELMRHENITTTQKYYVGQDANRTADVLWQIHESRVTQTGNTPATI